MKPNLDTTAEKASAVRMTSAEKLDMLQSLRTYADAHPARVIGQSVWFRQAFAYAAVFTIIVGTGATSFAAERSLPGDALYAVKTNVNEAVVRTLPLPATAKAKVEISMIDRRMGELEQMVAADSDTPEKVDLVMQKIEEHKEGFDTHLAAVASEQEDADEVIHAELETVVDTHIAVLQELTDTNKPEDEQVAQDDSMIAMTAPADDTSASDIAPDENADVAFTMQFRIASPETTVQITAKTKADPVDPIVAEITEFAEEEVRADVRGDADITASSTEKIEETRLQLRERILRKAEEQLDIDLKDLLGPTEASAEVQN